MSPEANLSRARHAGYGDVGVWHGQFAAGGYLFDECGTSLRGGIMPLGFFTTSLLGAQRVLHTLHPAIRGNNVPGVSHVYERSSRKRGRVCNME